MHGEHQRTPETVPGFPPLHGIEAFNHAVRGGELTNVQLGRGQLRGALGGTALGDVYLGFGRVDQALRSLGAYNPAGYNLGVILELPAPGRFWGEAVEQGAVVLGPPGQECDSTHPGPFAFGYLIVPPAVWEATVTALVPHREAALLRGRGVARPPAADAGRLTRRFADLLRLAAAGAPALAEPAVQAAARDELLGLFAAATSSGAGSEAAPCDRSFRHHQLVRRVEEYVRGREGEAASVRDLCRVADVSERTLGYAFREVLGLSPAGYVRRSRLSAVRAELAAAEPNPGAVTRVALRWGFWHLGEFAAAYRRQFGESPSQMLGRAGGGPGGLVSYRVQ